MGPACAVNDSRGGGFCKGPVPGVVLLYSVLMYTVLKVDDIRRPIETNIFFGVGRCIVLTGRTGTDAGKQHENERPKNK